MKRYVIVFEESAQADVRGSYDWGCRAWGKRQAQRWARQLRSAVLKQLGTLPNGFPGRYRVLFTIKGRNVHVLHVRGASEEPQQHIKLNLRRDQ